MPPRSVSSEIMSFHRSGRHTADASVWSAIATMLATLDGNDTTFTATFANGITQYVHIVHVGFSFSKHVLAVTLISFLVGSPSAHMSANILAAK